jgi:hypothetical protein
VVCRKDGPTRVAADRAITWPRVVMPRALPGAPLRIARLGAKSPSALESHGSFERRCAQVLRNLDRPTDRCNVKTCLRSLLDGSVHERGQLPRAMEHQHTVVG